MIGKIAAAGAILVLAVPALAVLTTAAVSTSADRCIADAVAGATDDELVSGSATENPTPTLGPEAGPAPTALPTSDATGGCVPGLGTDATGVVVPVGTPIGVAAAVRNALAYVGVTSGWH